MGVVEITEFIEPYKKIRNLRLKHKLTQKDIAGDIYSQTYITMIENGKFPLTKQFIKHFIAIINTKESVRLKIKDFRYDVKEHIQKSLDEKLAEIKSAEYCLTSIKNFEEMVMKNINQLCLTNFFFFITEIGKIYYHNSEIEMAKNSFYRLLSFSGNITDNDLLAEYLLYLTRIVFAFEQFKMIEDFEIIIDKNINNFKNDIKEKIYCNVITINFRADKYEKALEISEKYKKNVAFKRIPREIDMIVALCYKSLGETEKALKTYQKVNRYDKKEETKIWVNMNIMEIYKELGDIAAVEYRFKILRNIFNGKKIEEFSAYEKKYYRKQLKDLGDTAMFLNKIRFARNYYMELVSIEETIIEMDSDITIVFEVMKELIPMFGKKDLLEVEKVEKKYLSISKFKQDRQILFLIIEYYEKYKFIDNKNRLLMSIMDLN